MSSSLTNQTNQADDGPWEILFGKQGARSKSAHQLERPVSVAQLDHPSVLPSFEASLWLMAEDDLTKLGIGFCFDDQPNIYLKS